MIISHLAIMKPQNSRKTTGHTGEEAAVRYLEQQGYIILERNFRLRIGEVDIIARHGEYLVFIEVKTRRTKNFGSPFGRQNTHGSPKTTCDLRRQHPIEF